MDGVTRSLVNGKLECSRNSSQVTATLLPIHRSWEDSDVKAVLGQKLATIIIITYYYGKITSLLPIVACVFTPLLFC